MGSEEWGIDIWGKKKKNEGTVDEASCDVVFFDFRSLEHACDFLLHCLRFVQASLPFPRLLRYECVLFIHSTNIWVSAVSQMPF